jgi:hypothetical protein
MAGARRRLRKPDAVRVADAAGQFRVASTIMATDWLFPDRKSRLDYGFGAETVDKTAAWRRSAAERVRRPPVRPAGRFVIGAPQRQQPDLVLDPSDQLNAHRTAADVETGG